MPGLEMLTAMSLPALLKGAPAQAGAAAAGVLPAGALPALGNAAGGLALQELLGPPMRRLIHGPGQMPEVGAGQIRAQGVGGSPLLGGLSGTDPILRALLAMLSRGGGGGMIRGG